MKAIPQCRVSFPCNYNMIIHNIEKKICEDSRYTSDKWKYAFDFKNKNLCNSLKSTFPNTLKVKHLTIYLFSSVSALKY